MVFNKVKTIFALAFLDGRSRRKKMRPLFLFFTVGIFLLFLVNSLLNSIVNGAENIVNKPYGRTVSILTSPDAGEEEIQHARQVLGSEEGVGEIFWHIAVQSGVWENAEITGAENADISFASNIGAMERFVVAGTGQTKQGEILIPKYMYGMGKYGNYDFADGEELIGQTLVFSLKNSYTDETKEYSLCVVGVYDNVQTICDKNIFCVSQKDAVEIYDFIMCQNEENYIREIMDSYGLESEDDYESLRKARYIGIYIEPGYDISKVCKNIEEITGEQTVPFMMSDENLVSYYRFVIFVSNLIFAMFLILAVIAFLVMLVKDIRERKGQIALRTACGYTDFVQITAILLEKSVTIFGAAILAGTVAGICIVGGNYIIDHFLPFYLRQFVITFHKNAAVLVLCIAVGMGVVSVLITAPFISHLNPAYVLKKERGR